MGSSENEPMKTRKRERERERKRKRAARPKIVAGGCTPKRNPATKGNPKNSVQPRRKTKEKFKKINASSSLSGTNNRFKLGHSHHRESFHPFAILDISRLDLIKMFPDRRER